MKKVFVELHHEQLYHSLQALIEDRLSWELYRPIGEKWATEGYWMNAKIYGNHPDTIKQYLQIRNAIPTKMGPRNEVIGETEDYYLIESSFKTEKAVTLEQCRKMKPDVVIASYFDNVEPFKRLAKEVGAKFIMHLGNVWPIPWDMIDNVLSSTSPFPVPSGKNVCFYHQEIDLKTFYKGDYTYDSKLLVSFVNCLAEHDIHKQSWEDFQTLEKMMPEYTFKSYGISNRDGTIITQQEVADIMRSAKFGIHLKGGADGFGHVIFDWFALGKPVIFRSSQYKGKLAEPHLIHGVTGFDLEQISFEALKDKIISISEEEYNRMCENVYRIFKEKVDYNREEEEIKKFMENLI